MELTQEIKPARQLLFHYNDPQGKGNIGNKAESLRVLAAHGFNIPTAAFICYDAHQAFLELNQSLAQQFKGEETPIDVVDHSMFVPGLHTLIEAFMAAHPGESFAVRSSGAMEDMNHASFAGMYSTYLNLSGIDQVIRAVKLCWLSVYNSRVQEYCRQNQIPAGQLKMGVVLQRMVNTDIAGVAFSVNPVTGYDKEILVEAAYGLGEGLVAGITSPDSYSVDWYHNKITQRHVAEKQYKITGAAEWPFTRQVQVAPAQVSQPVLNDQELLQIAKVTTAIQDMFGKPVDVEWGMLGGELFVFQARPVTTISLSGYTEEWTTADFKDGGVSSSVCSPFMWSAYKLIWDNAMPEYLLSIAFLKKNEGIVWSDMFFGRPYWNLSAIKRCVERLPGYCERDFDQDLGIEVTYEGDGVKTGFNLKTIIHGIRVLGKLEKSFSRTLAGTAAFRARQEKELEQLDARDVSVLSNEDLFLYYEQFMREAYFYNESCYFKLIFDNSNYNTIFKDFLKKVKAEINFLNLIIGLKNVSHIRGIQSLWELASAFKQDAAVAAHWQNTPTANLITAYHAGENQHGFKAFRAYIEQYKFHSTRELDITVGRYDEAPDFVIENLKSFLSAPDEKSPVEKNEEQHQVYLREIERIKQVLPARKAAPVIAKTERLRQFLWWREEYRDLSTRFYYYVRKFTLEVANRWLQAGVIAQRDDIFFLDLDQITDFNKNKLTVNDISNIIKRNTAYYNAFRNYSNPPEIGSHFATQTTSNGKHKSALKGVPCSTGKITGTARVIKDIFDADRIQEGDILVTKFTDPGWTLKFRLLKGVITENGGVLSHAAVISREFGIPAILAVKDAMSHIKDGATITINGTTGEIEIH